jgi:mRNA-degrading endonuclease RelE of RelBE toxin-antitoxin system
MISLKITKRFIKALDALGPTERQRAQKSLSQFRVDPRHASLHFEKLTTGYHTIRVDLNFRIVMRKDSGQSYELLDVDSHKKIYASYG